MPDPSVGKNGPSTLEEVTTMKLKSLLLGVLVLCAALLGGLAVAFDAGAAMNTVMLADAYSPIVDEPAAASADLLAAEKAGPVPERQCSSALAGYDYLSATAIAYLHPKPSGGAAAMIASYGPGEDDEDNGGDIRSSLSG
jgi:hypothetical protein